eukprot:scaffold3970_cov417-Prasinococcus_capsulatus_cf.AAC.1
MGRGACVYIAREAVAPSKLRGSVGSAQPTIVHRNSPSPAGAQTSQTVGEGLRARVPAAPAVERPGVAAETRGRI